MAALQTQREHYPALDGIRGIAILLVVIFHNFGFINFLFFGWLGVDLFFVLSGFLITDILLKESGTPGFLKRFYMRRVLRIFPIYYLLLIITLLIVPALPVYKGELKYYSDNQFWMWTYLQNWLFSLNPIANSNALMHLWSLAAEEQYYLLWPFVILLVKKPKYLLAIILAVLLFIIAGRILLWYRQVEGLQYFSFYTFTRIDGICIGSALALILKISPRFITRYTPHIILSTAALNFVFYFINKSNQFAFPYFPFVGYTTFAVVFAVLVFEAASTEKNFITRPLCFPPLRFIGKVSYGFYIYHWPVFLICNPWLINKLPAIFNASEKTVHLAAAVASTLAGFLISVLSYYLIETRFLKLKNYFR